MTGIELVTKRTFYPEGCRPEDNQSWHFAVHVTWRAPNSYSLDWSASQMSRAGNWSLGGPPQRMNRRQYRFTEEEAVAAAREVVDGLRMNGRTWSEWQEFWAVQQAQEDAGVPGKESST